MSNAPIVPHRVIREDREDGSVLLRSAYATPPAVRSTGVWLQRWADAAPDRIFIAERSGAGWRAVTYGDARDRVRAIAASLIARGLRPDRPVAMLSGASVDHALLALAAQYVGVPMAPIAEQYSLIPDARDRLRHVLRVLDPGMIYVEDAERYGGALDVEEALGVEVVATRSEGARKGATPFASLERGRDDAAVEAAHAAVEPGTLAKVLFTSGSSGTPKGVPTTHHMMCVNQVQMGSAFPFLTARPPRILDWLPWNHVFGGSHNFNMALCHGGSYFIDNGRPTPAGIVETLANIRDQPGTVAFNVPIGYAMLVDAFRADAGLRRRYFADLDLIFYGGASLPQPVWEALEGFATEVRGAPPLMSAGWGMTETAPATLMVHEPTPRAGLVGVPLPGVTAKLLPDEAMRCELRVKGPNVMAGYFRDPEKTAESFDEEGFLITGDALRFVDPDRPEAGLKFDGRISEDFKLLTGTWVHASMLRLDALRAFGPLVQDIVITGHDRAEIGVLAFVDPAALDALGGPVRSVDGALVGDALTAALRADLETLAAPGAGSSTRIMRALALAEPPSIADQEVTNKGSLNVRRILARRAALVDRLYDDADPATIRPGKEFR